MKTAVTFYHNGHDMTLPAAEAFELIAGEMFDRVFPLIGHPYFCGIASRLTTEFLQLIGVEAEQRRCHFIADGVEIPHCWCESLGYAIDPTVQQFGAELPCVVKLPNPRYSYKPLVEDQEGAAR